MASIDSQIDAWAKEHSVQLSMAALLGLGRILATVSTPTSVESQDLSTPRFKHELEDLALQVSYTAYVNSTDDVLEFSEWLQSDIYDDSFTQAIRNIIGAARDLK